VQNKFIIFGSGGSFGSVQIFNKKLSYRRETA